MKYRLQELFLAILFALVGVLLVVLGLGFLKNSLALQNRPLMVTSGLIFFCAGMLLYFRTILGPVAENLPIFSWKQYFLILPILLGFGFIYFWAGIVFDNFIVLFLGLVASAAMIWFAISRWPGKAGTQ
jgi:hypothetical protein